jgi:hypothetical protein
MTAVSRFALCSAGAPECGSALLQAKRYPSTDWNKAACSFSFRAGYSTSSVLAAFRSDSNASNGWRPLQLWRGPERQPKEIARASNRQLLANREGSGVTAVGPEVFTPNACVSDRRQPETGLKNQRERGGCLLFARRNGSAQTRSAMSRRMAKRTPKRNARRPHR